MIRGLRFALSFVVGTLLVAGSANAATITFTGLALAGTGTSRISLAGTAVEAHNVGSTSSITAGGVTFDGAASDPFLTNHLDTVFVASPLTGSSLFDSVLTSAAYDFADATLTLNGLTIGNSYLLQIFVADNRTPPTNRLVTVGAPYCCGATSQSGALSAGWVFNGTFIADGSSQQVIFHGDPDGIPYLNAYQLRNTTSQATAVPEPASFLLMGTGMVVALIARRLKSRT